MNRPIRFIITAMAVVGLLSGGAALSQFGADRRQAISQARSL